ncbi:TPA: CHRD domain-containing protein [Candidatus Micrarchaeota archaeon]|nr:CHRD domain-containing protein [Candidatus Micrarchaeota archaeon]
MKISKLFLSAVLVLVFPIAANAAVFNLAATLTPGAEVPPVTNAAGALGDAAMVLNDETGMFAWIISFQGLTGPATAAHFHAGAVDDTGPPVLNLDTDPGVTFSGLSADAGIFAGTTTLSADAVMAVLSGNWYVNIHTEANGGGEIRGQVLGGTFSPVPLPATAWLFLSGLAGLLIVKRKAV